MASALVGKRILVDIQSFDAAGRPRPSRNFSGVIVAVSEAGLQIRRDDDGEIEVLFADEDDLEEAPPDDYWLRTTGAAVPQPDFLAEWTHYDELPGSGGVSLDSDAPLPPV